jgi:acetoin:2,6-dichlorophenolindophenol oxidoreductase subunit beta
VGRPGSVRAVIRELKYWQAVNEALAEELERNQDVILAGIDVGRAGGAFGASRGLQARFGEDRVFDTPISEATLSGLAVGAALSGLRPIIEIMFFDFIMLALQQLVGEGSKARYMYGGRISVPLVLRTMLSAHMATSAQHSSSYESWLCHVPGLKVVVPATPADAKGLLKAAVRDDNPVVVIESAKLWTQRGDVPDGDWVAQIGKAEIRRIGSDVTLVAWGAVVKRCLDAAQLLEADGISAEVVDLRSLSPLDWDTVLGSAARTGRLVVAQDAVRPFGVGAEILARASEEGVAYRVRPRRVAPPFTPVPFSPSLEDAYYPSPDNIADVVRQSIGEARA